MFSLLLAVVAKHSTLLSLLQAVRSTHSLEAPVAFDGSLIVSREVSVHHPLAAESPEASVFLSHI